ncbi:ABC transporter G family member 11 [Glycine soja]
MDEAKKYLTTGSEDWDGEKDKVRRRDAGSTPTPCPTWVSCPIVILMACNIHDESVSSAATCAYETKPQQSGIDIEATTLEMEAFRGPRKMNGSVSVTQKDEIGMICMTWKDVWVTASNRKNGSKSILQGLTGYAKPGQLLAIMGPSGCGKSTLLDTLAGRLGSNTRQTGEILINGHKQALSYGTSAYVTQDDTLLTTLTVREAVHYSAQLQLPDTMSKEEKKERADFTIREMGLQDAINTRIGGWGCKGISGGQERRVSICIEILTRPKLLFLDEPTSGLDSAASYYVMRRIATLAQNDHIQRTVIVSIHQPSSEVFQLFNSLCLLSSGKTVYFGPASAATEFFASNGFPCPPLMNPSDHLLKTINKDFDQDIEVGLAGTKSMPTEEVIHILLNSYKSSERNQEVQNEVAVLSKKGTSSLDMKRGNAGFLNQCLVLTKRSFINMYRDLGYYWLRLVIYIALAITLATVFYDLGTSYDSIKDRGSLVAFINGFITFMTIGGFPSFVEVMKVYQRERQNGHYGVTAFVIGNTLSSIPYLLLVTFIPGAISYYLPGLQKGCEHFLYFICVLFSSLMLVESLMMIVASVVPNYLMGIITGSGIQGIMLLLCGFFKLPNHIPKPVWKYPLHYVAFHTYANQGMFKNEYEGLRFASNEVGGGYISGEEVLRNTWQVDTSYSKWVDLAILIGMIVVYRVLFLVIIKIKEKMKPVVVSLSCMSASPKRTIQVLENPNATPLH